MNTLFQGKRPRLGDSFARDGTHWIVAAIAPGIIVGKRAAVDSAFKAEDLTVVRGKFA